MYKLYALSQKHGTKLLSMFLPQHWQWKNFCARKQLLLSARLSHHNSICLSVCSSVCLSHRWISQKRCKLGSPNLYRRLPGRL